MILEKETSRECRMCCVVVVVNGKSTEADRSEFVIWRISAKHVHVQPHT